MATTYQVLADATLIAHAAFVVFVVAAVPLTLLGGLRNWAWVRNWWFRVVHLAGIGVVVAQAWAGVLCPLTTLETWLRVEAGGQAYAEGFIQHWLRVLLFYEAPAWVFVVAYSLFGALVVATWIIVPPGPRKRATVTRT